MHPAGPPPTIATSHSMTSMNSAEGEVEEEDDDGVTILEKELVGVVVGVKKDQTGCELNRIGRHAASSRVFVVEPNGAMVLLVNVLLLEV